jgi:hypothetical protein
MSIEMELQDVLLQELQDEAKHPYSSLLKCAILTSMFGSKTSAADFKKMQISEEVTLTPIPASVTRR